MKLWVNLCFYYVQERLDNFLKIYNTLAKIPNIKIIINSNRNFDNSLPIEISELPDPYRLTWEHKKSMRPFLESDYTHFAYIEGNILVTKQVFDCWNKSRKLFKKNNLNFIPATHRTECDAQGNVYSLDCTRIVRDRPIIEIEGKKFISLVEPYQGMFIMDRELVEEHIHSDYFNVGEKGWWGIRESANLGNMFINIPSGYEHRAMLPLDDFSECLTPHLTNNYVGNSSTGHSKIKLENLFQWA
jgi:hypothetical protein